MGRPLRSSSRAAHLVEPTNDATSDLAFADTVVARGLDETIPTSGIILRDERCRSSPSLPDFAPPRARPEGPVLAPVRLAWRRLHQDVHASREELRELWSATACLEETDDDRSGVAREADPFVRAAIVGRRVRAFWSLFEWDRADLIRAGWIGLLVFVLAATAGALVLQASAGAPPVPR